VTAQQILDQLNSLAKTGDTESAHSEADDLLVEAVKLGASGKLPPKQAKLIIAAYECVEKWYA
jgi:hypothetical protein